jgi:hypothetical protein
LAILELIEAQDEARFEAAAVRWAGRLALETPGLTLAQLDRVIEALYGLPDEDARAMPRGFARRARPPRASAPGGVTAASAAAEVAGRRRDALTEVRARRSG